MIKCDIIKMGIDPAGIDPVAIDNARIIIESGNTERDAQTAIGIIVDVRYGGK